LPAKALTLNPSPRGRGTSCPLLPLGEGLGMRASLGEGPGVRVSGVRISKRGSWSSSGGYAGSKILYEDSSRGEIYPPTSGETVPTGRLGLSRDRLGVSLLEKDCSALEKDNRRLERNSRRVEKKSWSVGKNKWSVGLNRWRVGKNN